MQSTLDAILTQLPDYAIKVVGVLALFIAGRWLANRLAKNLRKNLERKELDPTLARFFSTMTRILVLVVVVLACLSIFGIETTSVAAVLGAAAFAVGLALQGSLANFAAGVMLVVFRPYRVDDVVTVASETGKVIEIGLFTTTLDTPDNRRIIIPNGTIFSGTILNVTAHPERRVDIDIGCDYGADLDATRKTLERAIAAVSARLDGGAHQVVLVGLGASSVDWQLRIWTKTPDFFTVREQALTAAKRELDAAGIGIPYPQMDVHIDGALGKAA